MNYLLCKSTFVLSGKSNSLQSKEATLLPLYISETVEAKDFKFGVRIDRQTCKPKNAKVGHKRRGLRHVAYFYNFGSCCMSLEARDFKFSVRFDRQACKPKKAKVGQEGRDLRHVTYFYYFGPPLYLRNG